MMAYEQSAQTLSEASEQGKGLGRAWMVRGAQEGIAIALLESGKLSTEYLENIRLELDEIGFRLPEIISGKIELKADKFDDALAKAISASDKAKKSGNRKDFLPALELQLRALLALERPEDVFALVEQGIEMAEVAGYGTILWRFYEAKAQALDLIGKQEEASEQYNLAETKIIELADTISDNKLKQGFLLDPDVAAILAKTGGRKQRRSNK